MVGNDRGSGLDAVGEEHAEQHRGRHTARDTEEQRRDQIAGLDGVVGSLGADDAAGSPLPNLRLSFAVATACP